MGMLARNGSSAGRSITFIGRVMGVSTPPGKIALARMPSSASSSATDLVMPRTANLLAA